MFTKVLQKSEISRGFIQIPAKTRIALFADKKPPFAATLNDSLARVDEKGRLWSEYLKNRYTVEAKVAIINNGSNFFVTMKDEKENAPSEIEQSSISASVSVERHNGSDAEYRVLEGDCLKYFEKDTIGKVDLTFFDPPYLQGKEYRFFDDNQSASKYWNWIKTIIEGVFKTTSDGGALYFMHREKNAEIMLRILRKTGWNFQNLIIWKKKTSAVPIETRFSKQYQIITYAIKGNRPRVFNKIRIDPPPLPWHKYQHENGVYLTDVWDDIRELTSGYFAGDEALRDSNGQRLHVQQTPVALLLRIILSSTLPGDVVFDPNAGSGTALVVAKQLSRNSVGIEIDPLNVELINKRMVALRAADDISSHLEYYKYSPDLAKIWPAEIPKIKQQSHL